jgi:hypothetical protein
MIANPPSRGSIVKFIAKPGGSTVRTTNASASANKAAVVNPVFRETGQKIVREPAGLIPPVSFDRRHLPVRRANRAAVE